MPKRSTLQLTKRTVDALAVAAKDTLFWDRDLAGFGVRVHAAGRKCYVVQSRGPAGLKRVTLGCHGVLATEEARKQAAVVIDRLKRGEAPTPAPLAPALTVAALAERFLRVHVKTHCKPNTARTYQGHLDCHILPVLGAMALGSVGRAEVAALHHRLRDTPATANAVVRTLSTLLHLAEAWELVPPGRNPCRAVRRYKQHARERFLTVEEYRRLGRVLSEAARDGAVWPPAIAALRLLVLTRCRHAEITALRWDDVDHTAGELRLRDAKTGPRRVPLTAPVAAVLAGIRRAPDNRWVIAGPKPGTRFTSLRHHWYVIRKWAGLDDVRIHDLRHSYASRALALGEGLPTIGTLLGHRKIATTARYAHLMRDAEKGAATRVGDSIGAHRRPRIAKAA